MTRGKQSSEYAVTIYTISLIFVMAIVGVELGYAASIAGIATAYNGVAGAKKWKHGETA